LQDKERVRVQQLVHSETLEPYRTERISKNDGIVKVWLIATALQNEAGQVYAIVTTEREIPTQN
jgi:two-component system CheB/CheR fusion protein